MHDFLPDGDVPRSFSSDTAFVFTGTDTPVVENAGILHLGTEYGVGPHIAVTASVDSELSPNFTSIGATGSFVYRW